MRRQATLAALMTMLSGCGGKSSPPAPSPNPAGPSAASVLSVTITGNTNLTAVGETSHLTATATRSDGMTEDVTSVAFWNVSDPSVADVAAGLLTSRGFGETTVYAGLAGAPVRVSPVAIRVLPVGTYILKGTVREPGWPIVGARVDIIDGPSVGMFKTTDSAGLYRFFGVAGDLNVRVSKDGYVPQVRRVSIAQDQVLDFDVTPTSPPVTLPAGTYRATFTASASCSVLPDDVQSLSYSASLIQDGARLDVTLSGPGLHSGAPPTESKFSGRIAGQTITFAIGNSYAIYYYGLYTLLEKLTSARYFALFGSGSGTIISSSLSGTLAGSFLLYDHEPGSRNNTPIAKCAAADHQFIFNK
jgi:hypothetical protein